MLLIAIISQNYFINAIKNIRKSKNVRELKYKKKIYKLNFLEIILGELKIV